MPEKKIKNEHQPYRMRLPGFVSAKDIGLGDACHQACDLRPRNPAL